MPHAGLTGAAQVGTAIANLCSAVKAKPSAADLVKLWQDIVAVIYTDIKTNALVTVAVSSAPGSATGALS